MRTLDKSGPWCWQEKEALRKIRDSFDRTETVASALGVYHALTECASNGGAETFKTTYAWLAGLSGLSRRTVQDRVHDLSEIGVVKVTVPTLKGPATYELLTIGNGCRTKGNGCSTIGKREAPPLPPLEEKKKEEEDSSRSAMVADQESDENKVAGSAFREARKGLL